MKKLFCFIFLFIFIGKVEAQPVNPNFDDDNFYDCIIMNLNEDEINGINNRDSKTYVATDEELSKMPTLACVSYNINSVKGLEKLTSITYVDFEGNNIKELDLTPNPKVIYLYTDNGVNVIGYDGKIETPSEQVTEKKPTHNYFVFGLIAVVIILLMLILTGFTIVKGIDIGPLKVLGILEIKDENDKLDDKVKQATKLTSTDYQKKIDDLNTAIKQLETQKNSYEDMVNVSTDSQVEAANQTYNNTIDFLFVRIENHAKSEGVTMKMEVTRSSTGVNNVYNLNFTATGSYTGIEEFITGIEDDSKLGFKIENFSMSASSESGDQLEATFVCKDITIQGIDSTTSSSVTTQVDTTNSNTIGQTNSINSNTTVQTNTIQ